MLCNKCWEMLRGHEGRIWKGTYDLHFSHHNNIQDLQNSAALICGICRILYQEWNQQGDNPIAGDRAEHLQIKKLEGGIKQGVDLETETETDAFSSTASLSVVREVHGPDLFRLDFRLKCGDKTRERTFILKQTDGAVAPFRTPVSRIMESAEVFEQAARWCEKCNCASPWPKWHPNRLIDLRNLKEKVQLDGAPSILKGQLDWEVLDNEVIKLVEKGDADFPRVSKPLNIYNEISKQNVHESTEINNRYVTLSHCWGRHRPKVLDNANKTELKRGIKMRDLPKTYKEAIQFASLMENVGWIWIDSLCIIQDDARDWTHESSDMQRVYREAFLNISATASHDSTQGLYRGRIPRTLWEDEVNLRVDGIHDLKHTSKAKLAEDPIDSQAGIKLITSKATKLSWISVLFKWFKPSSPPLRHIDQRLVNASVKETAARPRLKEIEGVRRCIILDVSHWDDLVNAAPVNVRGWVLQERLLAPRVLHFAKGQIAWECGEFEESEDYPTEAPKFVLRDDRILPKPLTKGLVPDVHGKQLRSIRLKGEPEPDAHIEEIYAFELWSRIVEDYSKLDLTECKDKLIALSGIAELVATTVLGSDTNSAVYRAGLWDKYLASQLLWKVDPVFRHHSRTFEHLSRRPRNAEGNLIYRAPSFSWASVDAQHGNGITYGEITDRDLFIEVHAAKDAVHIIHKVRKNLYGEVEGGHVMIWGQIRKIKLMKGDKGRFYWLLQDRSDVCPPGERRDLETEEHRNVYLDCPADDEQEILEADNVYCVPAALGSRTEDIGSKYIICLLLQHISESHEHLKMSDLSDRRGVYRRIGLTKLSSWADKRAYQYIRRPLATDRYYPQRPHEYGKNGEGRSLIRIE